MINRLDFADDISLLAETRGTLQDMTTNLETEAGKVGLRISVNKTEVKHIREVEVLQPITVGGQNVDDVNRFYCATQICSGRSRISGKGRDGEWPKAVPLPTKFLKFCF